MGDSYREEKARRKKSQKARRKAPTGAGPDRARALRSEYFTKSVTQRKAIYQAQRAQVRGF